MGVSLPGIRGGLVALAAALSTLSLTACGAYVAPEVTSRSAGGDAQQFTATQRALAALTQAVGRSAQSAGPGLASQIAANARTLGIRHLRLRYIDADPAANRQAVETYGAGAWVASISVGYRLPADEGPTSFETAFVFVPGAHGTARIVATGGHGERGALWLEGPVTVRRDSRALLITAGDAAARYWPLITHAVDTVDQVAHPAPRILVFEVPRSQSQLEANTGTSAGGDDLVAGDTASVDGGAGSRAPLHSFFNPATFRTQSRTEAQVVVTHEATLQATRAPLTTMPFWMEEGFADYVALDHAGIPLGVAAEHILAQTRKSGPPSHLPARGDFDYDSATTTLNQLNAVYEASWLACRYIAVTWGEGRLVAVYDRLAEGRTLSSALASELGITGSQLVTGWRDYLTSLAGTPSP